MCQATYDRPQLRLPDPLRRFLDGNPLDLTLAPFRPLFSLPSHLQREDMHFANDNATAPEPLSIGERSHRTSGDCSNDAGLLESLACSGVVRCLALVRPAFRNDPSSRLARRDEHDLGTGPAARSVRQSRVLNAFATGHSARITHGL